MAWVIYTFILAMGLSVGSFLNVVILRMPEGLSLVHPPSRCPGCGYRLRAWDNVPVLSWLLLRGRCRGCGQTISVQYPLVELAFGLMTLGLCWWQINRYGGDLAIAQVVYLLWPLLAVQVFLLGSLFASTAIDARHFMIPLSLCWLPFVVAVVVYPATAAGGWPYLGPYLPAGWAEPVMGAVMGLLVGMVLLMTGIIPASFADYEQVMRSLTGEEADTDVAGENALYPHPRREILKEVLFLMPAVVGLGVGWMLRSPVPMTGAMDAAVGVLGGALVGGGLIWVTRILGTLAFGKEAMGLGDVHLMVGVGAVLGWRDVTLAFFIAPFLGLLGTLLLAGLAVFHSARARVLPYGPYLSVASIVALLAGDVVTGWLGISAILAG
ncbi:Type 4 prepilin-like proteins leader peptide-processing enzyme [Mucisphaera calidilacus]|uniref:Type 4 prepilin-like proteins leader peptide-processing enzyme n=2 Tax=Mucisphaera calidilacus TaxID=2527982 RepID=A0A518BWE5_9BACT|nr:Type 4 prepilin-like proteins leader peptide-processing enzyme [Mucisphaera calidilacus]